MKQKKLKTSLPQISSAIKHMPPHQFHNEADAQDFIRQKVFWNSRSPGQGGEFGTLLNAFQSLKYKARLVRPFQHLKTISYVVLHLPTIANCFDIFISIRLTSRPTNVIQTGFQSISWCSNLVDWLRMDSLHQTHSRNKVLRWPLPQTSSVSP